MMSEFWKLVIIVFMSVVRMVWNVGLVRFVLFRFGVVWMGIGWLNG